MILLHLLWHHLQHFLHWSEFLSTPVPLIEQDYCLLSLLLLPCHSTSPSFYECCPLNLSYLLPFLIIQTSFLLLFHFQHSMQSHQHTVTHMGITTFHSLSILSPLLQTWEDLKLIPGVILLLLQMFQCISSCSLSSSHFLKNKQTIPMTTFSISPGTSCLLRAHSTTALGTRSYAFSRFTKTCSGFLFFAKSLSWHCLKIKIASVVYLPGIKPNWL